VILDGVTSLRAVKRFHVDLALVWSAACRG
jgi:hypothetical protein